MKKYTVILIRPCWVTEVFASVTGGEADSYIALVEAETVKKAVRKARFEIRKSDRKDLEELDRSDVGTDLKLDDYLFVCAYSGHVKPEVLGAQSYMWK